MESEDSIKSYLNIKKYGVDVDSDNFKFMVEKQYNMDMIEPMQPEDTVEKTYMKRTSTSGALKSVVIDVDNATWNKKYKEDCIKAQNKHHELIDNLRNLGICWNPEQFKNTYGFVKFQDNDLMVKLPDDIGNHQSIDKIFTNSIINNDKEEIVTFDDEM